jgi:hypothetical protein
MGSFDPAHLVGHHLSGTTRASASSCATSHCQWLTWQVTGSSLHLRFRRPLGLKTPITFNTLLEALVVSPGPGVLADLHLELLKVKGRTGRGGAHLAWAVLGLRML